MLSCAASDAVAVAVAVAEIIRKYDEGETTKTLAAEFGVARNSILNLPQKQRRRTTAATDS
ncbi:hypothetical protein [Microbacterium sp. MMO-10]|uniref:hypothetical protein n=1 Tax=Microbacterium sp. MMO-10 TaxID=3081272 RepID=UPI0030171141